MSRKSRWWRGFWRNSSSMSHRLLATARMVAAHQLSHDLPGEPTLPKRLAATGLRFDTDGENVAYNSTVEGANSGLMHSPPHRANMLLKGATRIGIAAIYTPTSKYKVYWALILAAPDDKKT